jgi:hypothetical protein
MGLSSQRGLDKNATAQDPSSSRALGASADRLAPEQDAAPPTVSGCRAALQTKTKRRRETAAWKNAGLELLEGQQDNYMSISDYHSQCLCRRWALGSLTTSDPCPAAMIGWHCDEPACMLFSRKGPTHADRPGSQGASRALAQLANGGGGTTPAPHLPPNGLPRTLSRPRLVPWSLTPLELQGLPRSRSQPCRAWSCQLSTVPWAATAIRCISLPLTLFVMRGPRVMSRWAYVES